MTTVLEALQNAQINFQNAQRMTGTIGHPMFAMAHEQLSNGIEALNNEMNARDVIQEDFGSPIITKKE